MARSLTTRPNERSSTDFVSDLCERGKVIRMLTIVDGCKRECPVIEVDTSLGLRVGRVLDRIISERGLPGAIVADHGPEFRGRALAGSMNRCRRFSCIALGPMRSPKWDCAEVGTLKSVF